MKLQNIALAGSFTARWKLFFQLLMSVLSNPLQTLTKQVSCQLECLPLDHGAARVTVITVPDTFHVVLLCWPFEPALGGNQTAPLSSPQAHFCFDSTNLQTNCRSSLLAWWHIRPQTRLKWMVSSSLAVLLYLQLLPHSTQSLKAATLGFK